MLCKLLSFPKQFAQRLTVYVVWGSSKYKKKVHLVSWDKVYRPKEEDDLGFGKEKEMKLAWITKLALGIVKKPKTL